MFIGSAKREIIMRKTSCRCSICGTKNNLVCRKFVPKFMMLSHSDIDNLIPVCKRCEELYSNRFIPIGRLAYLPDKHLKECLDYYKDIAKACYKYTIMFGKDKLGDIGAVENLLLDMEAYNLYLRELENK